MKANTAPRITTFTPEEFVTFLLPLIAAHSISRETPVNYSAEAPAAGKQNPLDLDAEIQHVLRHGSGFSGGKIRIMALYCQPKCPTPAEAAAFLKDEYGTGGHSHTFLDGTHGFVDYDSRGMTVRRWKSNEQCRIGWGIIERHIRAMYANDTYLNDREREEFNRIASASPGYQVPNPNPRTHYPPEKAND